MKRLFAALSLSLLAAACGGGGDDDDAASTPPSAVATSSAPSPDAAGVQEFTVRGNDNDEFVPKTFQVGVGTLKLTLKSGDVPHNLVFADRSLPAIDTVSGDETATVTLTFNKPGTYDFECTIHPGMTGKLVVA